MLNVEAHELEACIAENVAYAQHCGRVRCCMFEVDAEVVAVVRQWVQKAEQVRKQEIGRAHV